MQFSESWLRSFVNPSLDRGELARTLTMAGLEVEAMNPVAGAFSGVVVAQVQAVAAHPNADRLKRCRVDVGRGEVLDIVCGAPNVAPGMKVPCARVGAQLPGLTIKAAKVRGVESFGMLCSARELGIADDHQGLLGLPEDAPVGADLRDYLELDDVQITLKLTPNRSDCLSVAGIARELAALTGAPLERPAIEAVAPTIDRSRQILLDEPSACPRYLGRVVSGIDARAPTPAWMRRRLERSGLRSISAVVDVTNYVMLELGQPLHAFDDTRLTGAIHTRYPRPGETLLLLNEQTVSPGADTLLIADDARALALAGIMGGEESGIGLDTTELFLESAFFAPEAVAGKARAMGFGSDASYRFERGVDFEGPRAAIERATRLILDICGGAAGPVTEALARLPARHPIRLRPQRARAVLGVELDAPRMRSLLAGLELRVACEGEDFIVTPPSYRFDLEIEEDLIEELARLHGYDNIPVAPPRASLAMLPQREGERGARALRRLLAARDYQEVVNFSFVAADWERDFGGEEAGVVLANPIASQMSVMRSTLLGGLVGNLCLNLKRRIERVRVFEVGRCFRRAADADGPVPGFSQPLRLAALAAGNRGPDQWGMASEPTDFFDIKADVEALLAPRTARFEPLSAPGFHPGRSAAVIVDGKRIGMVGEIHPQWVQKYELGTAPVAFELNLDVLLRCAVPQFAEPSRFPAVVRDLALIVQQSMPVQVLLDGLRAVAPGVVQRIELFDVYQGKGIDPDKKSLAFRVVMQDTERTMEDSEADAVMAQLIQAASDRFDAKLRQ